MTEEQYDGMRVVDAQTGELRYRIRDSNIVNAQTGQLAFRIRAGDRVVDAATGQLVFRIRDGVRLVDANSGTLQFRLRGGVDTSFDFHSDNPPGEASPTLRRYHQLLWSKELPSGGRFDLTAEPGSYLVHRSHRGVFHLASDTITSRLRGKAADVIRDIPPNELPEYRGYTVGSAIVFPGNKIDNKMTINGARGCHPRIADRFDLTLECIRRHYLGQWSPLEGTLLRYADFFALFEDFDGYVNFFLLQDLVEDDDTKTIRFFHPFTDDFSAKAAVPKNKPDYLKYLAKSNAFIRARNLRIDADESGQDLEGRQP